MFQGTGSDVGKSLITAGLCRLFTRQGLKVSPFKPQNMSNNAAVTIEGGEIGRAQALQARACGLEPSVHFNPVLLKPQSDIGAQVVVHGKVLTQATAKDYQTLKPTLMAKVLYSFEKLKNQSDLVLVEGAGSAAEINLRANDIANMGFATTAKVPVVLIGDIDRGGVIASIVGTYQILPYEEQRLLRGFIVNRFRGDPSLFADGMTAIKEKTGLFPFGLVPHWPQAAQLPDEDTFSLDRRPQGVRGPKSSGKIKIIVPKLPHIANFDDIDPLRLEANVELWMIPLGQSLPMDADLILLPGSKATRADLTTLKKQGWDIDIHAHVRKGGWVIGLCGGFQMLGQTIIDREGVEGESGASTGLGLLAVETFMQGVKITRQVTGIEQINEDVIRGYEIHVGQTTGADLARPWLELNETSNSDLKWKDGAISSSGKVLGSYVHGIFASDSFRRNFLRRIAGDFESNIHYDQQVDEILDQLADHLKKHLNTRALLDITRV